MSDKPTVSFSVESNETFNIANPMAPNPQRARLSVMNIEGRDTVVLSIDAGWIVCNQFQPMRMRFGTGRAMTVPCVTATPGTSVTVASPGPVITQLRRNQPLTVQFSTYDAPNVARILTFQTEQFAWPRRWRLY